MRTVSASDMGVFVNFGPSAATPWKPGSTVEIGERPYFSAMLRYDRNATLPFLMRDAGLANAGDPSETVIAESDHASSWRSVTDVFSSPDGQVRFDHRIMPADHDHRNRSGPRPEVLPWGRPSGPIHPVLDDDLAYFRGDAQ